MLKERDGEDLEVRTLRKGDYLGELSAVQGTPGGSATVKAKVRFDEVERGEVSSSAGKVSLQADAPMLRYI